MIITECNRVLKNSGSICWQVGNHIKSSEIFPLDIILYPVFTNKDEKLIRKTLTMTAENQKKEIEDAGDIPIYSYNQTDFVKDRVAVKEVMNILH